MCLVDDGLNELDTNSCIVYKDRRKNPVYCSGLDKFQTEIDDVREEIRKNRMWDKVIVVLAVAGILLKVAEWWMN